MNVFSSVLGGYVARIVTVFSAGWVGLICGYVCSTVGLGNPFGGSIGTLSTTLADRSWLIAAWPVLQVAFAFDQLSS